MDGISVLLVADGGCRGNPGPMYVAHTFQIVGGRRQPYVRPPTIVDLNLDGTNNMAEYMAVEYGIESVKLFLSELGEDTKDASLVVYTDSKLVVCQLDGTYKINSLALKKLNMRVSNLLRSFGNTSVRWLPREIINAYLGC